MLKLDTNENWYTYLHLRDMKFCIFHHKYKNPVWAQSLIELESHSRATAASCFQSAAPFLFPGEETG